MSAHDEHRHAIRAALAGAAMALFAAMFTMVGALVALTAAGKSLFSGTQILVAWAILGVLLLAFFAFVFQRLLRMNAQKEGTGSIDIDIGGRS